MTFFSVNPDDMPEEVKAWINEMTNRKHGSGGPGGHGQIVAAVNYVAEPDEPELTEEQVKEDHERFDKLWKHVTDLILADPRSWPDLSDGDRLRVVACDLYASAVLHSPGMCLHRDRVQRDLLALADRLDQVEQIKDIVQVKEWGVDIEVADTRVPPMARVVCGFEWTGGTATAEHFLGRHWCDRKTPHSPTRHVCECGVSTRVKEGEWDGPAPE